MQNHCLVSASKGGGQQILDVRRDSTLTELEQQLLNTYLTDGENIAQQFKVSELEFHLATFNGSLLPDTIEGMPFTLELYCDKLATYPVRVYLPTCLKEHEVSRTMTCVELYYS